MTSSVASIFPFFDAKILQFLSHHRSQSFLLLLVCQQQRKISPHKTLFEGKQTTVLGKSLMNHESA